MCKGCWAEAGSPTEKTATTDYLVRLIKALYAEHSTGGPLHVHLDDWNLDGQLRPYYDCYTVGETEGPLQWLDDDQQEFEGRNLRSVCDEIAQLMNAMTKAQRYAVLAYAKGHILAGEPA